MLDLVDPGTRDSVDPAHWQTRCSGGTEAPRSVVYEQESEELET